jgi:DNA-binding MarR family transcriptional regulator
VILGVLARNDASSQQDLAEQLGINRTIMVKLVDKLEQAGCATRTRNPMDRRSYVLSITDKGRCALEEAQPALADAERRFVMALRTDEKQRLKELLRRLLPDLDDRVPASMQRTDYLISQAHNRLHRRADEFLTETGINTRHFAAFTVLDEVGAVPQQELAGHLGIAESAAVVIVDDLEQEDLVARKRDARDRRRYALELTAAGRERMGQARRALHGLRAEMHAALGHGGAEELRKLLVKALTSAA